MHFVHNIAGSVVGLTQTLGRSRLRTENHRGASICCRPLRAGLRRNRPQRWTPTALAAGSALAPAPLKSPCAIALAPDAWPASNLVQASVEVNYSQSRLHPLGRHPAIGTRGRIGVKMQPKRRFQFLCTVSDQPIPGDVRCVSSSHSFSVVEAKARIQSNQKSVARPPCAS